MKHLTVNELKTDRWREREMKNYGEGSELEKKNRRIEEIRSEV